MTTFHKTFFVRQDADNGMCREIIWRCKADQREVSVRPQYLPVSPMP